MKKLFTINQRKDASRDLIKLAKIIKIIHIVLAIVATIILFFSIIASYRDFDFGVFMLTIFACGSSFFFTLFLGWLYEMLLLGFSSVVQNHREELILKGKETEGEYEFTGAENFERLNKLNQLKKAGIITEEEFEAKKKEIKL